MTALPIELGPILLDRTGCMYTHTGVARYINGLQTALIAAGCEVRPFQPYPDLALARRTPRRPLRSVLTQWWHAVRLPARLARGRPGAVAHYTAMAARCPPLCTVITVHDLNPLFCPADFSRYSRFMGRCYLRTLDRADAIITGAGFVRDEMLRHRPGLAGRIHVVHHGYAFEPAGASPAKEPGLFLFVGGIGPNKNLGRAIAAFAACAAQRPGADMRFLIVGPVINRPYADALERQVRSAGLERRVRFLGEQPDSVVADCYRRASGFVFVSLREGFGFPVLEAQANGCACIASRTTSLPEVGGDGCLYVDPERTDEMADAMGRVLDDPAGTGRLVDRGRRNAARFSWDACARDTIAVYREALARHRMGRGA
jgi:glycosyltransferase involved in cell wall biosynthesis